MMTKGIKAYTGDRFELVHFSITIIFKTCNVVFNVSKVHEIRRVKVLRNYSITSLSCISDLQKFINIDVRRYKGISRC